MSARPDNSSFLDDALSFASREARHAVADSIACHLHNDGYALQGNTEGTDVEWFARNIYERESEARTPWDRMTEPARDRYRAVARTVMAVLPEFQLRVAHRLITLSKVVRDIERVERAARKAAGAIVERA